jgi:glutamyl-tRNA synthetase
MEWDKLWATNIKIIDSICPRFTALGKDNIAIVKIVNWAGGALDVESIPKHQKNLELGERPLFRSANLFIENEDAADLKPDEKVTLMKWGNIQLVSVEKDPNGVI